MEYNPNDQSEQTQYDYPPQQQYSYPQQQYSYPQQQYGHPYPQQIPNFLPMSIVAVAIAAIPVGSIVAIALGSKNRKRIQNYLLNGGIMNANMKVSRILSNAGLWLGVGMTIFYAIYFLLYIVLFSLTF